MPNERAKLSKKNKYWIPEERRMELIWFCRQYDEWKKEIGRLERMKSSVAAVDYSRSRGSGSQSSPTEKAALSIDRIRRRTEMVDEAAREADKQLAKYIKLSVTKKVSFQTLQTKYSIPVSKNTWTKIRHRFFWILDKKKE